MTSGKITDLFDRRGSGRSHSLWDRVERRKDYLIPRLINRLEAAAHNETLATGQLYQEAADRLKHVRDYAQKQVNQSPEEALLWAQIASIASK